MENKNYLTFEEAAEYIGVTKRYLLGNLVTTGIIPIYRLSERKRLVGKADLDKFIESCRVRAQRKDK